MSSKLSSATSFEVNSQIATEIRIIDLSILMIEQKRLQFAVGRAEIDKLQQVIARRKLLSAARSSRRGRDVRQHWANM